MWCCVKNVNNNSTKKLTTANSSSSSDLVAVSGKPFKNSLFFSRPVLNYSNTEQISAVIDGLTWHYVSWKLINCLITVLQNIQLTYKGHASLSPTDKFYLAATDHRRVLLTAWSTGRGEIFHVQGPDLQNILRQSYDNAKVTIDLRRTSNLQNILRRTQGFSYVQFTCKIVRSSKIVFVN